MCSIDYLKKYHSTWLYRIVNQIKLWMVVFKFMKETCKKLKLYGTFLQTEWILFLLHVRFMAYVQWNKAYTMNQTNWKTFHSKRYVSAFSKSFVLYKKHESQLNSAAWRHRNKSWVFSFIKLWVVIRNTSLKFYGEMTKIVLQLQLNTHHFWEMLLAF